MLKYERPETEETREAHRQRGRAHGRSGTVIPHIKPAHQRYKNPATGVQGAPLGESVGASVPISLPGPAAHGPAG